MIWHYIPDPDNNAPVQDTISDKSGNEGELLEFSVTATDFDPDDLLTFTVDNLPPGATYTQIDNNSAGFSWTPGYGQSGNYPDVHFEVQDNGTPMELDFEDIEITIGDVNRPPEIDPVEPISAQEYETVSFTITASDPDGDNVTLSSDTIPAGAGFNTENGSFFWVPNYAQSGTHILTFYATDDGEPNETAQTDVTITVNDILPTDLNDEIVDTITNELDLSKGVVNSYMANLKKVNKFIEDGKVKPAINQLEAFINKVNVDISDRNLGQISFSSARNGSPRVIPETGNDKLAFML